MVEGVSERTGGVPLFVEEVTRLLLERGEAGGAAGDPADACSSRSPRGSTGSAKRARSRRSAPCLGARFHLRAAARLSAGLDDAALQSALDRLAEADLLFVEGAGRRRTTASSTR